MVQYIPKDALVAEIERLIERAKAERVLHPKTILAAKNYLLIEDYNKLLSFLNTLEVKEMPIWEKVSTDTGQTTLYKDGGKSYLERFGYRIDLKDLDKLPKKNLKAQKGEEI